MNSQTQVRIIRTDVVHGFVLTQINPNISLETCFCKVDHGIVLRGVMMYL